MSFELKICFFLVSLLVAHAAATQIPLERLREFSKSCIACMGDEEMMAKKTESDVGEKRNPYVFEDSRFTTGVQTEHGRIRILQRFTDLLEGIRNYRVVILEADPQTLVVPNHWDADTVVFVTNGKGRVSKVESDERHSFNVEQGDVFIIKAGTTTYLFNRGNKEKLILTQLVRPINTPTEFNLFLGAGGESFLKAFSVDILEAAFNVDKDRLDKVFSTQKGGAIVKASQEQIEAMSQLEEGGPWDSKETVNLYQQRPTMTSMYGQLYEVNSITLTKLQEFGIGLTLANITKGGMTAPYYDSRATQTGIVVKGSGYIEVAAPDFSQGENIVGPTYRNFGTPLKPGMVVVVPAGHPSVAVASEDEGLQIVYFQVDSRDNQRFPLAGRRNVVKQLEKEAKALAFGVSAQEVDRVFNSQRDDFFFKGPQRKLQRWSSVFTSLLHV